MLEMVHIQCNILELRKHPPNVRTLLCLLCLLCVCGFKNYVHGQTYVSTVCMGVRMNVCVCVCVWIH